MCVLSTENQTVCALFSGTEPGKQDSCRQNRCVRKRNKFPHTQAYTHADKDAASIL